MLYRKYIGSVILNDEKVFLVQNDKFEWILPRIKVEDFGHSNQFYNNEFYLTYKLNMKINECVGDSIYEFYSMSKKSPMCNTVLWYSGIAEENTFLITKEKGQKNAGFYGLREAFDKITYTQEKNILNKILILKKQDEVCKIRRKDA